MAIESGKFRHPDPEWERRRAEAAARPPRPEIEPTALKASRRSLRIQATLGFGIASVGMFILSSAADNFRFYLPTNVWTALTFVTYALYEYSLLKRATRLGLFWDVLPFALGSIVVTMVIGVALFALACGIL